MCSHKKIRWIPNNGITERPMPILVYNDEVRPEYVGAKIHALLLCQKCGTTEIDDTTATLRKVSEMMEQYAKA